ncbi:hypothetical protein AKJ43_03410 [candidate division MSBL1 archaeon SCGC-AAA261D19]|uniref:Uncharacterized protein n=1 Tax=candidate division MSBL1 archaeon SCGC-AAA261D19 TaxID=1698273 RepID=A0A133V4K8_9EURY|nr:hypothetical protein AKJ43_03410 [candidate division MSBL1 archaeon SCGC-AAA261D19]
MSMLNKKFYSKKKRRIFDELREIDQETREAREIFEKYKELRKLLGKPKKSILDKERIKEDLTMTEIPTLIERIKERKQGGRKQAQKGEYGAE